MPAATLSSKVRIMYQSRVSSGIDSPVPSRYFFDQKYIYNYNVTSSSTDPYVQGVSTNIWQGKALGGGTAVNAQIYCRGASSVFDEWANISGNAGLAWNSLLQDFKANTAYEGGPANYTQPVDTSVFGNGPLAVSGSRELYSFDEPLASQVHSSLGLNQIDTVDGQGIGWTYGLDTITNDNNRTRSFAPNSYGALMNGRGNVRIVPNTQVTRIGFKKGTAQYVAFTNDTTGKTQRLQADEIIVTAGSINAVQLLLLSGVGPQSDLQAMKIPVVANISAVGANLIDHFYSVVEYKAAPGVETTWQWSYNKTEVAEANSEYRKDGDGPLGEDNVGIMAFQRLSDSIFQSAKSSYYLNMPKDRPNMAYLSATTPFLFNSPNETIVAGFSAVVQPESRGTVKLASTDPTDAPLVNFNFFGTPGDKAAIMAGYKNLRQLFGSKALKSYVVEEIYPGPQVTSDSQVFEAIKNSINSWHHAVVSRNCHP